LRRALDAAASLPGHRLRILNELGTVEMLRDARGERLEQARAEALRVGAVGLAVGIGANIAALLAMRARFDDVMVVAGEVERSARRLGWYRCRRQPCSCRALPRRTRAGSGRWTAT
jgi:hypothetical protein